MQRKPRSLLLSALAAGLVSCGGGSAKPKVQEASAQPEVVASKPAADAGNPVSIEVESTPSVERRILEYIPATYGLVLHLSLAKLEASEFFGTHESTLLGWFDEERQRIAKTCQLDPVLDVESITLGVDLKSMASADTVFAIATGLGATRVEDCIRAMGGKVEAGRYEIDGDLIGAYWPTEDVLLLSEGKSSEELMLELQKGRSLDNAALMQHLSRTDRNATLWGAGSIPSALSGIMGGMGSAPTAFVMRGNAWAGVDFSLEVSFATADEARQMKSMLDMALGSTRQSSPMGDVLAAIDIDQVDSKLFVDAQLSPQLAAKLIEELK